MKITELPEENFKKSSQPKSQIQTSNSEMHINLQTEFIFRYLKFQTYRSMTSKQTVENPSSPVECEPRVLIETLFWVIF